MTRVDRYFNIAAGAVFVAFFSWVYTIADDWPFRASLFPRLVCMTGGAMALLHLLLELRPHAREVTPELYSGGSEALLPGDVDHSEAAEADPEYVFATASGRDWAMALGWIAAFMVAVVLLGLLVGGPVFSVVYLVHAGGQRIGPSLLYGAIEFVLLWEVLEAVLHIALPTGRLLGA